MATDKRLIAGGAGKYDAGDGGKATVAIGAGGGGRSSGMSSKLSSWMDKQVKERPEGYSKKEIEAEMFAIKAGRMSREELKPIAESKGKDSLVAKQELYRRDYNKIVEKDKNNTGRKATEEDTLGKARSTGDYSEWKKGIKSNMATGGMVKSYAKGGYVNQGIGASMKPHNVFGSKGKK